MSSVYKIFVDSSEIYSGDFTEVPIEHRSKILEAFSDWGESLGKRSLNEMIYSLFFWYNDKEYHCSECQKVYDENVFCEDCEIGLVAKDKFEKNEKISHLLTCVGMITHIKVIN